ncbi:MAG TPA: TatD family hydrolase [Candidatus Saccharimonadales bacterium]
MFDTHCHVHEAVRPVTPVYDKWHSKGPVDADKIVDAAHAAGVRYINCVGTTLADSELAIEFAGKHPDMWASIGIHPHEAAEALQNGHLDAFAALVARPKVIAVGECGLDYFYDHSPREAQIEVLKFQLALAKKHDLPVIFHVREAFDDFWPVFEQYRGIRGVLHSFTDSEANLGRAVDSGLFIGVNGIATFAKNPQQLAMYRAIPLEKLLLETDAPFLTPTPYRGTICEPRHVAVTAEFVADLRGEGLEELTAATTANARQLFGT